MAIRQITKKQVKKARSNAHSRGEPASARNGEPDGALGHIAQRLAESPIMRRVPHAIRTRLERAMIKGVMLGKTAETIAQEFRLDRYGITASDTDRYSAAVEELIRPVASSQVIAGVLGCLPVKYRRRMLAGNQVLLLSKVANTLAESESEKIEAGELLKLASVLRAAAQTQQGPRKSSQSSRRQVKVDPDVWDDETMVKAVRTLFGLSWPLPVQKRT